MKTNISEFHINYSYVFKLKNFCNKYRQGVCLLRRRVKIEQLFSRAITQIKFKRAFNLVKK